MNKRRSKPFADHRDFVYGTLIRKSTIPIEKRSSGYPAWIDACKIFTTVPKIKKSKKRW